MATAVAPLAHSIAVSSRLACVGVGAGGLALTAHLPFAQLVLALVGAVGGVGLGQFHAVGVVIDEPGQAGVALDHLALPVQAGEVVAAGLLGGGPGRVAGLGPGVAVLARPATPSRSGARPARGWRPGRPAPWGLGSTRGTAGSRPGPGGRPARGPCATPGAWCWPSNRRPRSCGPARRGARGEVVSAHGRHLPGGLARARPRRR